MKDNFFDNIKCIVFDLDGTIYFGNQLADKALEVIELARSKCQKTFFVTNNSAKTRIQIHEKLIKLGINVELDEVINSGYAITRYLKNKSYTDIYCLGTDDLAFEISANGINALSETPQALVIGYDMDFNLSKLEKAINIFEPSCEIIVANTERTYPKDNGIKTPGTGAIVAAFTHTVNRPVDTIVGKPDTTMMEVITADLGLNADEILIVGDSLESDVEMAKSFGCKAILITDFEHCNDGNLKTIKKLECLLELMK